MLNNKEIEIMTKYAKRHYESLVKRIANYKNDTDRDSREKQRLCKTCYYLKGYAVFYAFTKYNCRNCGKEDLHHNSDTPKYCRKCADKFNICEKCGSER